MSQVTIRRPFGELNLRDQFRFEPHFVHSCLSRAVVRSINRAALSKQRRGVLSSHCVVAYHVTSAASEKSSLSVALIYATLTFPSAGRTRSISEGQAVCNQRGRRFQSRFLWLTASQWSILSVTGRFGPSFTVPLSKKLPKGDDMYH